MHVSDMMEATYMIDLVNYNDTHSHAEVLALVDRAIERRRG
jgi:hypothetical protein